MSSTKAVLGMLFRTFLPFAYPKRDSGKSESTLLIQHVTILDGTGQDPDEGDVRITGERIVAVAPHLETVAGEDVLDKKGLALAPGFIDMHSHASGGIFENPTADVMIRQGITTALVGQDGESEFPLAGFFKKLKASPASLNFASMVGQGTVREHGQRSPASINTTKLARMKELLGQRLNNL